MTAAVDNDILYKGAWYGLVRELLSALPSKGGAALILGHAKFVVGKRLERQRKKGLATAEKALAHLNDVLTELAAAEPTPEEQSFAARLENAAQEAGLALDEGESLLCAIAIHRQLDRFVTGDKRAICALEELAERIGELRGMSGRLVCLEQLFLRLLAIKDPATVRAAVCGEPHVDQALTICFSCSRPAVPAADLSAGLVSYIESLRAKARTMLDA